MIIELKDFSFRYAGTVNSEAGLHGINLSVSNGEFILLTGESGCGKTTLTRILNGLCPQFFEGDVSGSYLLNGENAMELSLDEIGMQIGNVFQDPRSQFFATNTTDEIVLAMENRNYSVEQMRSRLKELSTLLQIEELLDRNIFELSSGEKQKIAIAAACAVHPSVLILDEPSANLDQEGTLQLAELLKVLKSQGMTIIISEHRLHYMTGLIDRMVVMEKGSIKRIYSADEVCSIPSSEIIQMGLRLIVLPPEKGYASDGLVQPFMGISELSLFRQKKPIIKNLSMPIPKGKVIVITGKNGAGKSTLCKIIAGLLKEDSGKVMLQGKPLKRTQRLKQSFFVGQDADYQLFTSNVWDEVTLNLNLTPELTVTARNILRQLDLDEYESRHPVSLSGGQKQRVLLAASILRESKLLILDEPTSGLDGKHMRIIADILRKVAEQGVTVLLITHDMEFCHLVADQVLHMHDGLFVDLK